MSLPGMAAAWLNRKICFASVSHLMSEGVLGDFDGSALSERMTREVGFNCYSSCMFEHKLF